MPAGVCIRTKKMSLETRKRMSLSRSGSKHWNYGKKASQELRNKLSLAHTKNDNDIMSLESIHRRIKKRFGTPNYCEICKNIHKKNYEWSNKDHKYSLKKEDWQRLCRSCHNKFDIQFNKRPKPPHK